MFKLFIVGALGLLLCDVALAGELGNVGGNVVSALAGPASALIGAGVAGVKKIAGKKPPPIAAPAVMPTVDDEQVKQARRRQIAELQARGGRASTVLTDDNNDKLGG